MRASIVFAFLAFVFTLVGAMPSRGQNARRLAEGLAPLPPVRRSPTPVELAPRHKPSGTTSQCNTGPVQCCNSVASSNDKGIKQLLGLLGVNLSVTQLIGLNCSPIGLGLGGNSCNKQTVCCQNNGFNGLVNLGCTPINLKL